MDRFDALFPGRKKFSFRRIAGLALLVGITGVSLWFLWHMPALRAEYYPLYYDWKTGQQPADDIVAVDSLFDSLPTVSFAELPAAYKRFAKLNRAPYRESYQDRRFYVLSGEEVFRFAVGKRRFLEFLPKDSIYRANLRHPKRDTKLYLLLDRRVLFRFLDLRKKLVQNEWLPDSYEVISGYRHPLRNEKVGGASRSRHLWGEAVDLRVGDVDGDGRANQRDKKLLYELLDQTVIAGSGGLGRYPGTMSLHFDVRGRRARWDTF